MRIVHLSLLIILCFISTTIGNEESANNQNVENLKILRNSVNFAYKAGNYFLDLIRGSTPTHKPFQQAVITITRNDSFKLTDLLPIFRPFLGYIYLEVLGLLFVVFVPIVGFCFCCCRCAGKCGGKIKGMDPKHATCKRYTYAMFLGIISVIQLAGIVLAFINNQLIHDTLTSSSEEISAIKQLTLGTQMFKLSLQNISESIKSSEQLSLNNKGGLEIKNVDMLNLICQNYFAVLQNQSDNMNINTNLTKVSTKLKNTIEYLNSMKINSDKLKKYASEFLTASMNLKLDDIRPEICNMLRDAIGSDFEDLKSLMKEQINTDSMTGDKLRALVKVLNGSVFTKIDAFPKVFHEHVKVEYLEYRMYICIGICCLLLLIVLFYFLGLCFGQCGERPFEDARICNRGVGANLMMAGIAFAFLFTPMIMLLEIALFGVGGLAQTELCRYLTNSTCPGVLALDSVLQTIPGHGSNTYIKNNITYSIMSRCQSEPMVDAFNINSIIMSQAIRQKITEISNKVQGISEQKKIQIVGSYFKAIEGLLLNISAEVDSGGDGYVNTVAPRLKENISNKLTSIISEINLFSLAAVKDKLKDSFNNAAIIGFDRSLQEEAKNIISKSFLGSYKNVHCDGLSRSAQTIVTSACVTFLWSFNGFWYGVGICLVFTIPAIIFAVKLAGLYRRTEQYSADYEEPDYNSYMGFYTNNADNIPMKRPKSAKSNQKNRNSNSNNKDSLKQNNPQYLPVYPYDAYE